MLRKAILGYEKGRGGDIVGTKSMRYLVIYHAVWGYSTACFAPRPL